MRGNAFERARRAPASARSGATCSGSPKAKTIWRHGSGVTFATIVGAGVSAEQPAERAPGKARGNANGVAVNESGSQGAVVAERPIVVIDRRILARDCLVRCLREAIAGRTILAFDNAAEWLAVASEHLQPSVVLICAAQYKGAHQQATDDFSMLKASSDVPCIVLSDVEDCSQAVSAIEDGAQGFIPMTVSLDVAVQAVRLVEAGGTFIPASVLILSQRAREAREANGHGVSPFTVRQAAVLAALHQGRSNKQIAYQLQMSEGTVKVHVREIMKKVHARNRTEVVLRTHQDQLA